MVRISIYSFTLSFLSRVNVAVLGKMYKKIGLLCLFWIFNNIFKSSSNPNIFQNKRNIFLRVSEVLRRRNAYFSFQSIFSIQCWIIALRISRALSSRVCSLCSTITLWVKICTNNAIKGGLFVCFQG